MKLTYDEVRRILGDISDHMIVEVLSSGATISDLEVVAAHLAQETDVMGELERPLPGTALTIYNLLRQEEESWGAGREEEGGVCARRNPGKGPSGSTVYKKRGYPRKQDRRITEIDGDIFVIR